ncbi:MAG TPA: hypothetical protein VN200_08215 [Rhodoglobus sp.]|nr:hypothetical protein [Rhodoglobus sp.]
MSRRPRILLSVVALVVGVIAVGTAPNGTNVVDPFAVWGAPGEAVEGRVLTAEVLGARAGSELLIADGADAPIDSPGVWLVVDVELTAAQGWLSLSQTEVQIDGSDYRTSPIADDTALLTLPYGSDVPMRGSLVFELPEAAIEAGTARLVLRTTIDDRLDSVPVISLDLRELETSDEVSVEPPVVVSPGAGS